MATASMSPASLARMEQAPIASSAPGRSSGIAPGANLLNFRVLDANGNGSDSSVIAAIEQAIALKNKYNIRVINLSLGRPVFESYTQDPLCQAVEAAWKAGIVVVVAAGNDGRDNSFGNEGYGTIMAPGNDPYVITVGAMRSMGTPSRTDDLVASYSSKGPIADRSRRQARYHGARQPGRVATRSRRKAGVRISGMAK